MRLETSNPVLKNSKEILCCKKKKQEINVWYSINWASLVAQLAKILPAIQETKVHSWVEQIPWRQATHSSILRIPWWLRRQRICQRCGRPGFDIWIVKIPWRRAWQPTPVFLPRESHGQRGAWQATVCEITKQLGND